MAKHKYIETPEKMWQLFEAYRKEVKSKPILKHVFVGKDGQSEYEQRERPLTIEGFRNYARKNVCCVQDYFANTNGAYNCLLYTSPSPRDGLLSRMPSSA